ncbi:MAG: NAD(P)-dependent oxidoreductase [Promethearchaeia archaeon]
MKTVLITGATGFIGSWLLKNFLKQGFRIFAHGSSKKSVSRLRQRIKEKGYTDKKIEYWEQDFRSQSWDFPDFREIDFVIHCAALTSVRQGTREHYDEYFKVNVVGTKKLAQKALTYRISHFLHFSSGQIYGKPRSFPINEHTPKEPINIYGFTKLMSEEVIKSFGTLGLNYTIVRPFSVYGRGQTNIISIIGNKIKNNKPLTIFGDGTQKRAFMHIKDICAAINLVLGNKRAFHEEFNLSGPEEYSVNDLVEMMSQQLNNTTDVIYEESEVDELQRNIADTTKIQNLGFSYEYFLPDYIAQQISKD